MDRLIEAVVLDAVLRQTQTVDGVKAIGRAMAEIDPKAAAHFYVEAGMRAAAAASEAVAIAACIARCMAEPDAVRSHHKAE